MIICKKYLFKKNQLIKCPSCGKHCQTPAEIPIEKAKELVKCFYCGAMSKFEKWEIVE